MPIRPQWRRQYDAFASAIEQGGATVATIDDAVRALEITAAADFDRRTWTARLGMGVETFAQEQIGVVVDELPLKIHVQVKTEGKLLNVHRNRLLAVRIDYQVGASYCHSALLHGNLNSNVDVYDASRDELMPWGTGRQPDEVVRREDFSNFDFSPREYAPIHWSGRAQITYLMQNCGPHTRAKITLGSEDEN